MTQFQLEQTVDLLWEHLPKDPEHKDRRVTGWGTKTNVGLFLCIERIVKEKESTTNA